MKRLLLIQARMGSQRLPGKVLMDLGGKTMLERVVARTRRARRIDEIVLTTTTAKMDDVLVSQAVALDLPVFRGEEDDVLSRFHSAAVAHGGDMIVRVTADCPLIDPQVIDKVVAVIERASTLDFVSNTLTRTYPRGLDVEACQFSALARAWRVAQKPFERAHVFPFIYSHPDKFVLRNVEEKDDHSHLRWTVDTAEDLKLIRALYAKVGNDDSTPWRVFASVMKKDPALQKVNRLVRQKAMEEG
jgi:spore coat polysaccharide biosynthesis protein SpsF